MNKFEENIINIYGEKSESWLADLPTLTQLYVKLWNLSELQPVTNLSFNYVLSGWQDKKPIILKLGIDIASLMREINALKAFQNFGGVDVLAEDLSAGSVLLKRAMPGHTLKSLFPHKDVKAIKIAIRILAWQQ